VKKELRYYDLFPTIVRANSRQIVTLRPHFDHARFAAGQNLTVTLRPAEGYAGQTGISVDEPLAAALADDGALVIPCAFEREGEYILIIERPDLPPLSFRLYALDADLFNRKPYRGDLHMHSSRSDGKESPAYVAATCRKIGLDFMALTDHRQYKPSLEAIHAFDGVETDLRIFPGEEIHPPENRIHIVNFGGSFSINALFESPVYRDEVQAIASTLRDLPPGMDPYPYASCMWVYEQIRRGGGLGIFCHPYWFSRLRYDSPRDLVDLVYARHPFDALELLGGFHPFEEESNQLQIMRYAEERAKGKRYPVVGVSDAHGCETGELFGWFWTLVFSPGLELPDLIGSIKDFYSVAVSTLPGQTPRAYGEFRLVRYAQFLLREVLPLHDELCVEEGRLLLAHAAGDENAAPAVARLKGRVDALYRHIWAE
jgi:hypothetical protein